MALAIKVKKICKMEARENDQFAQCKCKWHLYQTSLELSKIIQNKPACNLLDWEDKIYGVGTIKDGSG